MKPPKEVIQKASEIKAVFYFVLFDSDSDKGEEIIVADLSIKCAIAHCNLLIKELNKHELKRVGKKDVPIIDFYEMVIEYLTSKTK